MKYKKINTSQWPENIKQQMGEPPMEAERGGNEEKKEISLSRNVIRRIYWIPTLVFILSLLSFVMLIWTNKVR